MPATAARELMRKIGERAVTSGFVTDVLGDGRDGVAVLATFESLGFVQRVDDQFAGTVVFGQTGVRDDDLWATTVAGNALAKARIGKPIPRAKAQALLDGLIARAEALNADDTSAFVVEEIKVFGSFAEGVRDEVGDVDVSLIFARRVDNDRYMEMTEAAAVEAERKGKKFRSFLERLAFLELQFQRILKAGSGRLDIQFDPAGRAPLLPDGATVVSVYRRQP
jgi:hypothetical protein